MKHRPLPTLRRRSGIGATKDEGYAPGLAAGLVAFGIALFVFAPLTYTLARKVI